MKRGLLLGLLSSCLFSAMTQDDPEPPPVHLPKLPAHGSMAEYLPKGWKLEVKASGDLNGDGKPDTALVLHQADPHNVIKSPTGPDVSPLDTNPRLLLVLFADAAGGYSLALQNSSLIPRHETAMQEDNFGLDGGDGKGLAIARGALSVSLHYFSNAGGWDMGNRTFTFRYQDGAFRLIGYDGDNLQRNTQDTTTVSANYLTGRMIVTRDNDGENSKVRRRVSSRSLPRKPLLSVEQVGDGMEFTSPDEQP